MDDNSLYLAQPVRCSIVDAMVSVARLPVLLCRHDMAPRGAVLRATNGSRTDEQSPGLFPGPIVLVLGLWRHFVRLSYPDRLRGELRKSSICRGFVGRSAEI